MPTAPYVAGRVLAAQEARGRTRQRVKSNILRRAPPDPHATDAAVAEADNALPVKACSQHIN